MNLKNFKKIILVFLIFIFSLANLSFAENEMQETIENQIVSSSNLSQSDLHIYSDAVIIIDNKTGKTLYEKNAGQKMYPASTTKILTAILALEKGNLSDEVTVSREAIAEMKPSYSSADLVEGEVMTVENLLTVLLVHSANDASNVLAEYISGSISEFVNLMNTKVQELGCTNTHFVTTNGLHDENHYTTAKDMAIIARYCMKNPTFRKMVSMKTCTIPATNKSSERIFKNTNDMVNPASGYYYQGCIGIKTGFTSEAKNCLVSAVNKKGLQLIAVVFGASVTENNKSARYVDSRTLYDYVYDNFTISTIARKSDVVKNIEIKGATDETKSLDLLLANDISAMLNIQDEGKSITPEIKLNDNIKAPIAKNTIMGTATYTVNGTTYTENLLASHDVEENDTLIYILRAVLISIFVILILFIVFKIVRNKNKNNK